MEILVSIAAIIVILALLPYAMPVLGSILLFILMPFAKLFAWIGAILLAIIGIPLFIITAPFIFLGYLFGELIPDLFIKITTKLYSIKILNQIFKRLKKMFNLSRVILEFMVALGFILTISWNSWHMFGNLLAPIITAIPFFLFVYCIILLKKINGENYPEWFILTLIKDMPRTTLISFYIIYIPIIIIIFLGLQSN